MGYSRSLGIARSRCTSFSTIMALEPREADGVQQEPQELDMSIDWETWGRMIIKLLTLLYDAVFLLTTPLAKSPNTSPVS